MEVEDEGGGRDAAAAAIAAARDEEAVSRTRASYGYDHLYVEWFIWVGANGGLSYERCHQAAAAALQLDPSRWRWPRAPGAPT